MKLLKLVRVAVPVAILVGCGGSDGHAHTQHDDIAHPAGLQSALETPIIDCQTAALDCRAAANDSAGRLACNDTLAQCLGAAATKTHGIAQNVVSCRDEGIGCLRDGTGAPACRDSYQACVDAALNGGDSDDAGRNPAQAAPVTPPDIDVDSGLLPPLPGSGLVADASAVLASLPVPVRCTFELRICVFKDPTAAAQCADTARTCLQQP